VKDLFLAVFFSRVIGFLTLVGFVCSCFYLFFGDGRFNLSVVVLIVVQAAYLITWVFQAGK